MNNLIDKKALIIGASGGMGSAVASMLSKNGVHCFLVGRSKEKLNEVFSSCSSDYGSEGIFSENIQGRNRKTPNHKGKY